MSTMVTEAYNDLTHKPAIAARRRSNFLARSGKASLKAMELWTKSRVGFQIVMGVPWQWLEKNIVENPIVRNGG